MTDEATHIARQAAALGDPGVRRDSVIEVKDEALLPCPFCGAKPHQNLGKVWHCQLHGDRNQDHIIKCPHLCVTMTGSEDSVRERWNRRADLARPSQAGMRG